MKDNEAALNGEIHYKDVIYVCAGVCDVNYHYVWCEYHSRLHTPIETRYRIKAYYAEQTQAIPNQIFKKRDFIADSKWRKTPQKCREDIENDSGIKLGTVVKEDPIGVLPQDIEVPAEYELTNSTDQQFDPLT